MTTIPEQIAAAIEARGSKAVATASRSAYAVAATIARNHVPVTVDGAAVDEAMAIVQSSRRTHVEWAEYLTQLASCEQHQSCRQKAIDKAVLVGDVQHHETCIEGYDKVLAVLATVPTSPTVTGGADDGLREALTAIESELEATAEADIDLGDEYLHGMRSAIAQIRERVLAAHPAPQTAMTSVASYPHQPSTVNTPWPTEGGAE